MGQQVVFPHRGVASLRRSVALNGPTTGCTAQWALRGECKIQQTVGSHRKRIYNI
eukprot:GDKH01015503.1.p1 GENE.GDKH01015503.1~~GDKH01015503.1.p1  ORF type:complete len:55 (-),score=3.30 GDKH01015503.1:184-348(-)